jgi:hypothetical protein
MPPPALLIEKMEDSDIKVGPELKNLDDFLLGDASPLKRQRIESEENMDRLDLIRPNTHMETGIRNSVDIEMIEMEGED